MTITEQIRDKVKQVQSKRALARESAVSLGTIKRFANQNHDVKAATLDRLAEAMGLEVRVVPKQ